MKGLCRTESIREDGSVRTAPACARHRPVVMSYRCISDPARTMAAVSASCQQITGFDPRDFTDGRVVWDQRIHPEDRPCRSEALERAARTHDPFEIEYRLLHRDGRACWVREVGHGVCDEAGDLVAFEGFVTDISDQRLAQESLALERSEQAQIETNRRRLFAILEATPDMVSCATPDGQVRYMNRAAREILGIPLGAELGDRSIPQGHPDWANRLLAEVGIPAALRDGDWLGETAVIAADGREIPVSQMIHAHKDAEGTVEYLSTVCRDITALKQAEAALAESEARYRALMDLLPAAAYTCDAEGRITYFNEQAVAMWGRRPRLGDEDERFCGSMCLRYPDGAVLPHERTPMASAIRDGSRSRSREVIIDRPDGRSRSVLVNIDPIRDRAGRIAGAINVFVDISERKQAEEERMRAQRLAEQRATELEAVLDAVPAAVWIAHDADCRHITGNRTANEWLGLPSGAEASLTAPAAARPGHIKVFCNGAELAGEALPVQRAARGQAVREFEEEVRLADGTVRILFGNATPLLDERGRPRGAVAAFVDITARKRAERALGLSEARLRQLADAMPQLVWTARPDGIIDYCNRRASEYEGLARRPDGSWSWLPAIEADDRARTVATWEAAITSGEPFECEHRVRLAGGALHWQLSRAVAVRDETGGIARWIGTSTDIQDVKSAQEALQEADRRKDAFLATLAHELRNPLAPIANALGVLKLKGGGDATGLAAQAMIERQLQHLVRLIDDLLDVSRITRGRLILRRERVALARVLEAAIEGARPHLDAAGHALTVVLPPETLVLDADPVRLGQVFLNLLNNACKFTDPGGQIQIAAECDGAQVSVRVRDNGRGVAAEDLPRLFEMFTQLGDADGARHGGLGIGLALARGLVTLHGGRLEAYSPGLGQGCELLVCLPVMAAAQPPPCPADEAPSAPGRSLRVLVADDNPDVVDSLAMLLDAAGHRVTVASDGEEALAAAERDRPDVVLLDIGMPKRDGYEVCRALRAQPWARAMRILALTGWGQADDRRKAEAAGFDDHLVKPLTASLLLQRLEE